MNNAEVLLAAAEDMLRDDIAQHAKGDLRYKALLSANAVAMARRELLLSSVLKSAAVTDVSAAEIRAGEHDDDGVVADVILREAALRAYVANPGALSDEERDAYLADVSARGVT
jgi:hypothetical protein